MMNANDLGGLGNPLVVVRAGQEGLKVWVSADLDGRMEEIGAIIIASFVREGMEIAVFKDTLDNAIEWEIGEREAENSPAPFILFPGKE